MKIAMLAPVATHITVDSTGGVGMCKCAVLGFWSAPLKAHGGRTSGTRIQEHSVPTWN